VGPTCQPGAERGEGGAAGGASPGGKRQPDGAPLMRRPAGPAERPRPNGGWGKAAGREGKKKWAVAGPKVRMGQLHAGPVGPKVRKISFLNKI
jgi:hypothetical protein